MLSINDLPKDVLVGVFSCVPCRDLVIHCSLVCSFWKDVVDLPTLWRRKCQLEGFLPKGGIRNPEDWKRLYFLFKKNLLRNPCAKEEFEHWTVVNNEEGDFWEIETLPGVSKVEFPGAGIQKCFGTTFEVGVKSQTIDLLAEGFSEALLDDTQPQIVVEDWYAAQVNCVDTGALYVLCVQLQGVNHDVLAEYKTEGHLDIDPCRDGSWTKISHTFSDYGPGVRYIMFQHGAVDIDESEGWYGVRVTNSSVIIEP